MMDQLGEDLLDASLARGRDVMHGNHESGALRFRREREDGRQRRRTGPGHAGFSVSTGAQTSPIAMLSPSALSPQTGRSLPAGPISATDAAAPCPLTWRFA